MTIIDTSGWLEYFTGGINSNFFAAPIKSNSKDFENVKYIEKSSKSDLNQGSVPDSDTVTVEPDGRNNG